MVFFRGHLIGHHWVSEFDELLDREEISLKIIRIQGLKRFHLTPRTHEPSNP
jgi:hypothetical protein